MKITLKQLKQLVSEAVNEATYDRGTALYAKGWHIVEGGCIDKRAYATKEEALAAIPKQRMKNDYSGVAVEVHGVVLLSEFIPAPETQEF